jgi:23S rRNA pseudouridine2604 synthase
MRRLGPKVFAIILTQGLNRQIRRMCEALGYTVEALQRVRIMHVRLGELPLGRWRQLSQQEIAPLLPRRK